MAYFALQYYLILQKQPWVQYYKVLNTTQYYQYYQYYKGQLADGRGEDDWRVEM